VLYARPPLTQSAASRRAGYVITGAVHHRVPASADRLYHLPNRDRLGRRRRSDRRVAN